MTKRISLTLVILVVIALSTTLFACDSTPDYTNDGLTVSGKFIYDGAPLEGVKIILDFEIIDTTTLGDWYCFTARKN